MAVKLLALLLAGCVAAQTDSSRCTEVDADGDGFSVPEDCDDGDPGVSPAAVEVPYDGVDNDCSETTLDDDLDADGYPIAEDCDDGDPGVSPAAVEVPYDGVDNDCSETTLDDDLDADGYPIAEDCDDGDPARSPAAVEDCGGLDMDCDGYVNGQDGDGDGWLYACDNCPEVANPPTGSFTSTFISVNGTAGAVVTGDFNGDGHTDMVAVSSVASVTVLLGDGHGRFADHGTVAVSRQLNFGGDIGSGDIDADGDLDLLIPSFRDGVVDILLNDGAGVFTLVASIETGSYPVAVALGDTDGDGDVDAVVGNYGDTSVVVLQNDGSGGFSVRQSVTTRSGQWGVALADMDGDGDVDIAAGTGQGVRLLSNDGTGSFEEIGRVVTSGSAIAVELVDLDADGDPDLAATVDVSGDGQVQVFQNRGSWLFQYARSVSFTGVAYTLSAADLNADGLADLATMSSTEFEDISDFGGWVHVILNGANFIFRATEIPANQSSPAIAAGDLDGDADVDLVAGDNGSLGVLLNDGRGEMHARSPHAVPASLSMAMGDIDGDGDPDLLVGGEEGGPSAFLFNDGTGRFASETSGLFMYGMYSILSLADINGDGSLDLMAFNGRTGDFEVWFNNGSGSLYFSASIEVDDVCGSLSAGDLDGDHDVDFVAPCLGNQVAYVLLNDGEGNFTDVHSPDTAGLDLLFLAVGDMDGDGSLDLVVGGYPYSFLGNSNRDEGWLGVLFNHGDASFTLGPTMDVYQPYHLAVGDADSDGDLDVFVGSGESGEVMVVMTNDGTGTLAKKAELDIEGYFFVADVDLDGSPDVVSIGQYETEVLLNDGSGEFESAYVHSHYQRGWPASVMGDLDGDGDADIAVAPPEGLSAAGSVLFYWNDGQRDEDGDGVGDACDPD